jgi:hypothetical protein
MRLKNNLSADAIFDSLTSRYSWYDYHQDKRDLIKRAIEEGLEAKYLVDPRFNMDQMLQIYTGLKNGVDVSKYAKTRMRVNQMITLREAVEEGIDVSKFSKLSIPNDKMQALIRCIKLGFDISIYCDDKTYRAEFINEMIDFKLRTIPSKK